MTWFGYVGFVGVICLVIVAWRTLDRIDLLERRASVQEGQIHALQRRTETRRPVLRYDANDWRSEWTRVAERMNQSQLNADYCRRQNRADVHPFAADAFETVPATPPVAPLPVTTPEPADVC